MQWKRVYVDDSIVVLDQGLDDLRLYTCDVTITYKFIFLYCITSIVTISKRGLYSVK